MQVRPLKQPGLAAPTLLDRIVGYVNPQAGLQRMWARNTLQRAYEAASPRDSWRPRRSGASSDADHMADARMLRSKARALVQNVPYIRAGMDQLVGHVIGGGILTRFTASTRLQKLWMQWQTECDADGMLDWAGLQSLAYRTMEQDGEVLIRLRPRRPSDGLAVPLQIQLLEIDWLDTSRMQGGLPGNRIINGIEYDQIGREAAFWLWDQHPGDVTLRQGIRTQSKRVPAELIIHLFRPERPGAGRGFTRLASVIARVRDLQLYEDAELARKNLESRLGVLVSGDAASMANPNAYGSATDTANPAQARASGDLGQLASGGITELPPGVNVTTLVPNAVPGHVAAVKLHLHLIAVGFGITYEMMTGDMTECNFSSARVRMLQFRRVAEADQWQQIIPRLCIPVVRAFEQAAADAGLAANTGNTLAHSPPKWDYMDPQAEIEASILEVAGGMVSLSEQIRRRGDDPETVFKELDADAQRLGAKNALDLMLQLISKGRTHGDQAAAAAAPAATTTTKGTTP